ncbi:MAG: tetratricopeptide repeat protein [Acidobacteriota bacterium]|nr:tetratricopeptide repeat protein [Acidobacteriota bacterium]
MPHTPGRLAAITGTRRRLLHAVLLGLSVVLTACHDAADEEYLAALRGDEDGSTYEERIAHLDRAIALEPARVRYWESRAVLRIDGRALGHAASDLDRAIALGDRPYLRFLRGLVRCQQGDCAAGLPDFDRAIAEEPDNSQFYRGRALARVTVGRLAEALDDGERLVGLAPQFGPSYFARGAALAAQGRHAEAIRDFDEALRRMPELVYPLAARADAYEALGEAERAAADREVAARKQRDRARCAYCLDPFRY